MSFDFRVLFAFCLCFLASMFAGCDSASEDVAEKEDAEVVKPVVEDNGEGIVKKSFRNTDSNPSRGIEEQDVRGSGKEVAKLPSPDENAPDTKKVIRKVKLFDVAVAGGALNFKAPSVWKKGKPGSRFVESEITVPKSGGDDKDGRLTIMRAGGSVEANIQRWYGQYSQPNGSDTKDVAKVTKSTVGENDNEVVWVDISGTLLDKPGGPMSGGSVVEREDYRMLAAIIQAGEHGQCFVKLYGPRRTISDNEAAFRAFVGSLEINDEAAGL